VVTFTVEVEVLVVLQVDRLKEFSFTLYVVVEGLFSAGPGAMARFVS